MPPVAENCTVCIALYYTIIMCSKDHILWQDVQFPPFSQISRYKHSITQEKKFELAAHFVICIG